MRPYRSTSRRAGQLFICLLVWVQGAGRAAWAGDSGDAIVVPSALLRVVEQVSTPARAAGVLATLEVDEGDVVEEGALLASIDDAEVKLLHERAMIEHALARERAANDVKIRSAKKMLDFSVKEHERLKRAAANLPGSISESELDESRVAAEQAELDLEQARQDYRLETLTERLKRTDRAVARHNMDVRRILAPLNGMVVEVLRRKGEWVEPGEDVLRIMRIDRLRAEGLVAVQDVLRDLVGARAEVKVSVPGRPDVTAAGRVVFVSPEINPVNGQVRVRAEFANPEGRLRPGMRATMIIHPTGAGDPRPAAAETPLSDPAGP